MENSLQKAPNKWKYVMLDEVCKKITNGGNFKQVAEPCGLPVTRIETISYETIDLSRVKYCNTYTDYDVEKYKLEYGDILLSHINSDTHLGKTAIFTKGGDIVLHGINLLRIQVNEQINPFFLNYVFKLNRYNGTFIKISQKAVNQSSINQKTLKQLKIPLPPLDEQIRIVRKIEELFSEIDKGVENLNNLQKELEVYWQATLKSAFEGQLTAEWRNAHNTIQEFEIIVREFKAKKINLVEGNQSESPKVPDEWILIRMGDCIEQPKYGTSKKCNYSLTDTPVLRIPNIGDIYINTNDLKFAEFGEQEKEAYKLNEGDILTIRSNGSVNLVGKSALVRKIDEQFLYAGYLIRLRPMKNLINSKYLLYALKSNFLRDQIESKAKSTSGVNNINSNELKDLIIPLCSLREQEKVVEEIESRFTIWENLFKMVSESLEKVEALKQSILKKAFEGKLVPQDPNDEPVEKLIGRIKAQK